MISRRTSSQKAETVVPNLIKQHYLPDAGEVSVTALSFRCTMRLRYLVGSICCQPVILKLLLAKRPLPVICCASSGMLSSTNPTPRPSVITSGSPGTLLLLEAGFRGSTTRYMSVRLACLSCDYALCSKQHAPLLQKLLGRFEVTGDIAIEVHRRSCVRHREMFVIELPRRLRTRRILNTPCTCAEAEPLRFGLDVPTARAVPGRVLLI